MKFCLLNMENLFLMNTGPGEGYKKPLDKVEWLGRTLQEIDADICMLCEVGGKESLDLFNARYLGNSYVTALLPGNSDRGIEMGYLIHKRLPHHHRLQGHKERALNFSYPHELEANQKLGTPLRVHRFSRDVSELWLMRGEKVELILFLVHLKSKLDKEGIDPLGQERRKAELQMLVALYNTRRGEYPGVPLIVAGDFNGHAQRKGHEPAFADLYQKSDLEDVLEVIGELPERRHSYFHFSRDNAREASQLDYILLPPELHALVCPTESGIYLYRDPHGVVLPYPQDSFQRYALPSDHYPLVLSLKI